jgi:predicted TIM-barrel fold metal-dependent hydrolase
MAKQGFKVMDSDIHVTAPPDLWVKYIESRFRDRAPRPLGEERWEFEGRVFPAYMDLPARQRTARIRREKARDRHGKMGREGHAGEGHEPHSMLNAMDIEGVDVAIVFRTMGSHVIAIDGLDPELSAAVCRAFNNWVAHYCDANRERLKPAAIMPMHDVDLAVHEAQRAVRELGAVALVLSSHPVNQRPWYDPGYDPLWAQAERLNVAIAFHGIQMAYQEHLGRRYMDNFALAHSAAHPVEMMLAMASLLTGGVLERFPGLRAAFLEGHCSWVPWWLWCLDEHVEKFGDDERFPLKAPPSEYFRRQCYVSVDADEEPVRYAVQAIGDENIVVSTDWPHDDSAYPHAIDSFLRLEGLEEKSKRKIL